MRYLIAICLALISLMPAQVRAAAVHYHCDVKAWGPIISSLSSVPLPHDYRASNDTLNFFDFTGVILNPGTPKSAKPGCHYEISDITRVEITFEFYGTMEWDKLCLGGLCSDPLSVVYDPVAPISFGSSGLFFSTTATRGFNFEPHQGTSPTVLGPIERVMPGGAFPVMLLGDNNGFEIVAASIRLIGNHYYVPEPASLPALLLALGFTAALRPRRR